MKSCLIVDDSTVIRKAIRRIMEPLFGEIREAEDGLVALNSCKENMPTVVMLDWNMPVMTGIDFLKNLRKTAGGDKPFVVLCTTETSFDHIQEALSEGANEYIMKPFNEDIIREKLQMLGAI